MVGRFRQQIGCKDLQSVKGRSQRIFYSADNEELGIGFNIDSEDDTVFILTISAEDLGEDFDFNFAILVGSEGGESLDDVAPNGGDYDHSPE